MRVHNTSKTPQGASQPIPGRTLFYSPSDGFAWVRVTPDRDQALPPHYFSGQASALRAARRAGFVIEYVVDPEYSAPPKRVKAGKR